MYFAHLPAGYITAKLLSKRIGKPPANSRIFMFWGLLGSVAPDFDFTWCLLHYHRLCDHHKYFTHYPLLWLALLVLSGAWFIIDRYRHAQPVFALIFFLGGLVHTLLDMFTGRMFLLAPFSYARQQVSLAEYGFWDPVYLECFIVLWAVVLWKKRQLASLLAKIG